MIGDKELEKLQKLAKLSLASEDSARFSAKLKGVIDMIDQLHEVKCDEVEPLRSVCEMSQRMVSDEVSVSDVSGDLFKNVPGNNADFAKEIKCFIVPKVVE
ncbi:MAG: Asp-tRNA(Asn)/Glu-tRNA(Gln) amidotransferase subunit GatC [Rickettsiaceae bacterium]